MISTKLSSKFSSKRAAFMTVTLGLTAVGTILGTIVGTPKSASALPVLDVLQAPLNAVLGRPQTPPPARSTDLQVMNGNLNGNNVTFCTLTCGLPGIPGLSGQGQPPRPPVGAPPLGGVPVGLPPGARPPAPAAAPAASNGPALVLPPIPLPNPF